MAPVAFAAMCGQVAVVDYFLKLNDLDLSLRAVSSLFSDDLFRSSTRTP